MQTRLSTVVLAGALTLGIGCQNYLDVNQNPNAPETVGANLYLPPLLHWLVSVSFGEAGVTPFAARLWPALAAWLIVSPS